LKRSIDGRMVWKRKSSMVELGLDQRGDVVIITPVGSMTAGNQLQDLSKKANELLKQGCRQFIISLENVTAIDSGGLGIIFGFHKRVFSSGGQVVICRVPDRLQRVFKVMDFDCIVQIRESLEESLKELS
jgi:stage II sporulation protein AA (anti-sigma F factor antagonist)